MSFEEKFPEPKPGITPDYALAMLAWNGNEAGWKAAQAELREPRPCGVVGHTLADCEKRVVMAHEELTDNMVEEGYSHPGGQGEFFCRACEREAELRRKVDRADRLLSALVSCRPFVNASKQGSRGSHNDPRCYRGSDDGCFCGIELIGDKVESAIIDYESLGGR